MLSNQNMPLEYRMRNCVSYMHLFLNLFHMIALHIDQTARYGAGAAIGAFWNFSLSVVNLPCTMSLPGMGPDFLVPCQIG